MAVNLRAMRVSRVCKFKLIYTHLLFVFMLCFLPIHYTNLSMILKHLEPSMFQEFASLNGAV